MNNTPYKSFNKFLLRVPIHSLDKLNNFLLSLDQEGTPLDMFRNIFDDQFKEALYIASPHLYEATERMLNGTSPGSDDIMLSLLKYITRMSCRCTPFGIFSGCCIGHFAEKTSVCIGPISAHYTSTRLDMELISGIVRNLQRSEDIKRRMEYRVNSSLYSIGDQYRYVDYHYRGKERMHVLSSTICDPYLKSAVDLSAQGVGFDQLLSAFNNVDENEATRYLYELIDNKVIISDLDLSSTGNQLLPDIIQKLLSSGYTGEMVRMLERVHAAIRSLDQKPIGRQVSLYKQIYEELSSQIDMGTYRYAFQSDLGIAAPECHINWAIQQEVLEGVSILNRLNYASSDTGLNNFIRDFYARYEEEEIPLSEALDTDIGIGFTSGAKENKQDINDWLEDIPFKRAVANDQVIMMKDVDRFILGKYESWIQTKAPAGIVLNENELAAFPSEWKDTPSTIFAITEMFQSNDGSSGPSMHLSFAGGTSAATILGRFCHLDDRIDTFTREIIAEESHQANGNILAEITHIPQDRVGNILFRPILRPYEIPYLSNSSVDEEHRIPITDLMVSVRNGFDLRIRSKRLNKYIIPRLTSSHNYATNALPMYYFLCAVQSHNQRISFKFKWGDMLHNKEQLPRVSYKRIILSPARWNLHYDRLLSLTEKSGGNLLSGVRKYKEELALPDRMVISQGDNKLMVDLKNDWSTKMLIAELKSKRNLMLEEFLFNGDNFIVHGEAERFCNQVILFFKKENNDKA